MHNLVANPNNRMIKVNFNKNTLLLFRNKFYQTIKIKSGSNKLCIVAKQNGD